MGRGNDAGPRVEREDDEGERMATDGRTLASADVQPERSFLVVVLALDAGTCCARETADAVYAAYDIVSDTPIR